MKLCTLHNDHCNVMVKFGSNIVLIKQPQGIHYDRDVVRGDSEGFTCMTVTIAMESVLKSHLRTNQSFRYNTEISSSFYTKHN